jgi:hypothetical protein
LHKCAGKRSFCAYKINGPLANSGNERVQLDRILPITHIGIETETITNEKIREVNDIFYMAMGVIGIKNLGKGVVHFAQNLPNNVKALIRENKSIRELIVAKYFEYRIAITKLKNSDEWVDLPAEVRQQIIQQEKSFITLADAKNILNDSWGASKGFLPGRTIEEILSIIKGKRPLPETYLRADYIQQHLKEFEDGVTKFMANTPSGAIGPPSGTFVLPKKQADILLQQSGGNIQKLEDLLGLERGTLGNNPVRVDIGNPIGLRMSDGNELGANNLWIPGGKTSGGLLEATINQVQPGEYVVGSIVNKIDI